MSFNLKLMKLPLKIPLIITKLKYFCTEIENYYPRIFLSKYTISGPRIRSKETLPQEAGDFNVELLKFKVVLQL